MLKIYGEHKFELVDNGNDTTTFKQSEIFKGIPVPLFKRQRDHNTRKGFEEMNNKLKELSEQKSQLSKIIMELRFHL